RAAAAVRAPLARRARLRGYRKGLSLRPDRRRGDAVTRDLRLRRDGDRGLGGVLPRPPRARRPPLTSHFRHGVRHVFLTGFWLCTNGFSKGVTIALRCLTS